MNPIEVIIIFIALGGALLAGYKAAMEEIDYHKAKKDFIDYYSKAPLVRRDKNHKKQVWKEDEEDK